MSLTLIKLFSAIVILVISLLAAIGPFRQRWRNNLSAHGLGEALASGVFLGASLFHMLPDATENFRASLANTYPWANLLCALGFVSLLFLERITQYLAKRLAQQAQNLVYYLLVLSLAIHALTEGLALGVNAGISDTLIIFIAIIVHKGSESFSLAHSLARSPLGLSRLLWLFILFALMTPLGIAAGTVLKNTLSSHYGIISTAIFNALAAGTFLYIATLHQHHHHTHETVDHHPVKEFIALLFGLAMMAGVAIWV